MPDIAIEVALQPWIAFQTDGLIMLSDILTPLPALRIEVDVKGECPCIPSPICRLQAVNNCQ
jgi:uroporphyrinogen-III decarboxylase